MVSLEHRQNDRVIFSLPVQYKIFLLKDLERDIQDPDLGLKAAIEDMSRGGLQIVSDTPFEDGAILELEVTIPEKGPTRTIAKVIWCRQAAEQGEKGFRSGIQFIPVFEEDLKKVNEYFQEKGKG